MGRYKRLTGRVDPDSVEVRDDLKGQIAFLPELRKTAGGCLQKYAVIPKSRPDIRAGVGVVDFTNLPAIQLHDRGIVILWDTVRLG